MNCRSYNMLLEECKAAPKINNIKAHFELRQNCANNFKRRLQQRGDVTWHNNFAVVRDVYTYIIFPDKGFINITGIKSVCGTSEVISKFCKTFDLSEKDVFTELTIDNISSSGTFGRTINLDKLLQLINSAEKKEFTVHFDRNFYPGAFCKKIGFGTVTVFSSGKYVIVGPKCSETVTHLARLMYATICKL